MKKRPRKSATPRRAPKAKRQTTPSVAELQAQVKTLTRQLTESLEQQTATSEVLKVISSSPGELEPVFQIMLENACRICDARFGTLFRYAGGLFHRAAGFGTPAKLIEFQQRRGPFKATGTTLMQVAATKMVSHSFDELADPSPGPTAKLGGARSVVGVPMLKDNDLVGAIVIYRQEVRPFTDKQIELVKNFAAQAVIAIENTRLLSELRQRTDDLSESLEQQTATSEVLSVISSSPGELEPVFQSMLKNSVTICEAKFGQMFLYEHDAFRVVANLGVPPALAAFQESRGTFQPRPGGMLERLLHSKQVLRVVDALSSGHWDKPAQLGNQRSLIAVPMLKKDTLIGVIVIYRQEVRPFTDKQVELVSNFAAQAVIAIENARLLGELRQRTGDLTESLAQQTATSEVLKVISSSPGELEPVFEAMLMNAVRICGAKFGVTSLREGDAFRVIATHGAPRALEEQRRREPIVRPTPGHNLERMLRTKEPVHVPDILADPKSAPILAKFGGAKALVNVPLLKNGEPIGSMVIFRQEAGPFTDKQIELLKGFAAQAVIAIENTRLLSELRESLERQTATSEVLSVIASSPGNLEPVFQTMLQNAIRLCGAKFGTLFLYEKGQVEIGAFAGVSDSVAQDFRDVAGHPPVPGSTVDRMIRTGKTLHIDDLQADKAMARTPVVRAGGRSYIGVPLLKDGVVVGALGIYRMEVKPFTDNELALVVNFAAQAVIAIENARLLGELRQRTDDLSESLEQQTATSEVLKVISTSPGELEPVFEVMLANAARLCGAKLGALSLRQGDAFRAVATHGASPAFVEARRHEPLIRPTPGHNLERLVRTKDVVHIPDLSADKDAAPVPFELAGARALLNVPLLKDDELTGSLLIYRQEAGPFTDKQIELVQNFAAQAVIAIENTRLLSELRQRTDDLTESLEQQTATSEVLKVISGSPGELGPVFDAMLVNATRICEAKFGVLHRYDDGAFYPAALHNVPDAMRDFLIRVPGPAAAR